MTLGIVGSERAKFTEKGEAAAKALIRELFIQYVPENVCSGECHLGGIDKWAHEEADMNGIPFTPFPPVKLQWEGGYKQRNLKIAKFSDLVVCISVDHLPLGFQGMKFGVCYHCANAGRDATNHVKSGGCYTVNKAIALGKQGLVHVVSNY